MSFQVDSYKITVTNLINNIKWEKECDCDEFFRVNDYKGKETASIFRALITPIRTNDLKNFVIDLLLPVTLTRAIKVNHLAIKVLAVFTALFFDFITLPIRLVTCIPRIRANAQAPEDLLLKYLKEQKVDPKLLESDSVFIQFNSESIQVDSQPILKKIKTLESVSRMVHFIELPYYNGSDFTGGSRSSSTI